MTEEIQAATERYWREGTFDGDSYLEILFPREVAFWRDQGLPFPIPSPANVLVLLVGYSWEPLIISVYYHQPAEVLLVLNKRYGPVEGRNRGETFIEYCEQMVSADFLPQMPQITPQAFQTVEDDTPQAVFKFLKQHALPYVNEGKKIVVDVTGSKKSMVAGAYLFSTYTNSTVAYIDFEEYDPVQGRPYGYSCRPRHFDNPLEKFKIGNWTQVRHLYESGRFAQAISLVREIQEGAREYHDPEEEVAIQTLIQVLQFYERWAEGDYRTAQRRYLALKENPNLAHFPVPSVIHILGDFWFDQDEFAESVKQVEKGAGDLTQSIYSRDEKILAYAANELEICQRIFDREDYRSALLRSAGLFEFLLKARIIRLWISDQFVFDETEGKSVQRAWTRATLMARYASQDTFPYSKLESELLKSANFPQFIRCLRWKDTNKGRNRFLPIIIKDRQFKGHRTGTSKFFLAEFWKSLDIDILRMREHYGMNRFPYDFAPIFRNKAIHFCLPVSREIASVSITLARGNLADFRENWLASSPSSLIVKPVEWREIIDMCNLTFLPNPVEEVDPSE